MAHLRKFSALNHLLTLLPRNRANPIFEIEAILKVAADYFCGHEDRLKAGRYAFEVATAAALRLVGLAYSLNNLNFWEHLELPRETPRNSVPEPDQYFRKKKLFDLRQRLKGTGVSRDDLVEAMDLTNAVFRSMNLQFAVSYSSEIIPADERYLCAALLPATTDLLNRMWVPLRPKLKKSRMR